MYPKIIRELFRGAYGFFRPFLVSDIRLMLSICIKCVTSALPILNSCLIVFNVVLSAVQSHSALSVCHLDVNGDICGLVVNADVGLPFWDHSPQEGYFLWVHFIQGKNLNKQVWRMLSNAFRYSRNATWSTFLFFLRLLWLLHRL